MGDAGHEARDVLGHVGPFENVGRLLGAEWAGFLLPGRPTGREPAKDGT